MKPSNHFVIQLLMVYLIILVIAVGFYYIFEYLQINAALAGELLTWSATIFAPNAKDQIRLLNEIFERDYRTLYLYSDLIESQGKHTQLGNFKQFEQCHEQLLTIIQAIHDVENESDWKIVSQQYEIKKAELIRVLEQIKKDLVNNILHRH